MNFFKSESIPGVAYKILLLLGIAAGCYATFLGFSSKNTTETIIVGMLTVLVGAALVEKQSLFKDIFSELIVTKEKLQSITNNIDKTINILSKNHELEELFRDAHNKGIKRILTEQEVEPMGREALSKSDNLKVIGFTSAWLVKEENDIRLKRMLNDNKQIQVIIPNPLADEIKVRYQIGEPSDKVLGRKTIAIRIITWYEQKLANNNFTLKVYDHYPTVTTTFYDDEVYVSSVLFKRQTKDNLTTVFDIDSTAGQIYLEHFNNVYIFGSADVDDEYILALINEFPELKDVINDINEDFSMLKKIIDDNER